jgi:hypothetical protein
VDQIRAMVDRLGVDVGASWSGKVVTFGNGSKVVVFDAGGSETSADKQGRGDTYHRIHLTEAAFYPYAEALVAALMNGLPPPELGGELSVESTPNGAVGLFYEMCRGAMADANGLALHFFPWYLQEEYQRPGAGAEVSADDKDEAELVASAAEFGVTLTAGQLKWWREQRALKGRDRTVQEFPHDRVTCFLLSGTCYFDLAALARIEAQCVPPMTAAGLREAAETRGAVRPYREALAALAEQVQRRAPGALRVFDPPQPAAGYVVGFDTSLGKATSDFLAAPVFNRMTGEHVATLQARVPIAEFTRWVYDLANAYGGALLIVERNSMGHTALHILQTELRYEHLWLEDPRKPEDVGFYTGPHNRMVVVDALVDAVTQGHFKTRDREFVTQSRGFVRTPEGKVEAAPGAKDDLVMAAAIGWHAVVGPRVSTTPTAVKPNTFSPFG